MSDTTERARRERYQERYEELILLGFPRSQAGYKILEEERDALAAELAAAEAALTKIKSVVDAQAEDEALWALYPMGEQPISEAYLQQELRHLHTVIEAAAPEGKP